MNNKAFTLIELLGVIIIISIIMLIAIPNVVSVLDKNKKDSYIADAKKLVTQAQYEIRNGSINKPATGEIVKITLSRLGTSDIKNDPNGDLYNLKDTYVVIVRKNGYLEYYVNLVANDKNGNNNGISLVNIDKLSEDGKYELVTTKFELPDNNKIKQVTGISGQINIYE